MENLIDVLASRRTIRKFKPEPISPLDLKQIIVAAQRAPTSSRLQVYSFIRVTDQTLRQKLAQIAHNQSHIIEAPEFFVICADVYRAKTLVAYREGVPNALPLMSLIYGLTDALIAVSFLVVAAEALGYGTCFIGGIKNSLSEVVQLLGLPTGVLPIVGVCIGLPDEIPGQQPRLPMDIIMRENNYGQLTDEDLERCLASQINECSDDNWWSVVNRYWGEESDVMSKREQSVSTALKKQGFGLGRDDKS